MNESRREIIDRLVTFMGELGDSGARVVAEQLLMHAIHKIWIRHPFRSFLMPDPYLVVTAAGVRSYVLPPWFGRIANRDGRIRNLTSGDLLCPLEGEELYLVHPEAGSAIDTDTGDPSNYVIAGVAGVNVQLTANTPLEAVSSSVDDVDVQAVLEGVDNNGQFNQIAVTLNGTAPVALGTWRTLQMFSKSFPQGIAAPTSDQVLAGARSYTSSRGTIKLQNATDHVTIYQTLLPHESLREQSTITFWKTPQAVQSIAVPILRLPRRLVNDADPVPAMWGPALFEEARKEYAVNNGDLSIAAANQLVCPATIDLMCWDNELRSGGRSHTVPFGSR